VLNKDSADGFRVKCLEDVLTQPEIGMGTLSITMGITDEKRSSEGPLRLVGDRPHPGVEDPLGFEVVVRDLADLIVRSRDATPLTLGIEGTWGTGKSTLMGALRVRLELDPRITTVQFNAWTAEEGRVLEAFVKTVLTAIEPRYLSRAFYRRKAFGALRFGISAAAGLIGQSRTVDKLWEQVATDPRARNELRDLVGLTVDKWRKKSAGGESRTLCVFVDDLDRCSPAVVLEVLEAMKLYLDVAGVVFVVGYDENIVSEVVLQKKGYGDKTKARDYLEKFIQTSYRIPPSRERQSEALIRSLLAASGIGHLLGAGEQRLVIDGSIGNPRAIKRFINRFVLVYGLDPTWRDFSPQSVVRALLLQMYFPEFARLLEPPTEGDPVAEFLEFAEAQAILRREMVRGEEERKLVNDALTRRGLPKLEAESREPRDLLRMLEEHVRVEFHPLVGRPDFVALARGLRDEGDWDLLRAAFARGDLARAAPSEESREPLWQRRGFFSHRVLWVDDRMENNAPLIDALVEGGADVRLADNTRELMALLEASPVEVLVSDIDRKGDPEAGFDDLRRLRAKGKAPSRVVFFTGRVTPARKETAEKLGAVITANPDDLLNFIAASPGDER
jgi:CheY-like chemotaxis protein